MRRLQPRLEFGMQTVGPSVMNTVRGIGSAAQVKSTTTTITTITTTTTIHIYSLKKLPDSNVLSYLLVYS
jgi:hypothetical protein